MKITKNDINWNKVFIAIYVIAAIFVIVIIWKPANSLDIAKYQKLETEDVDKLASEKYINKYINKVYDKDAEYLYSKLNDNYILYNRLDKTSFDNSFNREFNIKNLFVSNVQKIEYIDKIIYRVLLSNDKKLNIIEKQGKDWEYTLYDFYDFNITNFYAERDEIKFTIDSIYQAFDYIEITCYIENMSDNRVDIHMEREDSVILKLNTNEIVEISNAQIDRSLSKIDSKTVSSRTFKFNISLKNQATIEQIIFNNLEINGEEETIKINLDFN